MRKDSVNIEIYAEEGLRVHLSDEHAPDGRSLLIVNDEPFGRSERLPRGGSVLKLVRRFVENDDPSPGRWGPRTDTSVAFALRFIAPHRQRPAYFDEE